MSQDIRRLRSSLSASIRQHNGSSAADRGGAAEGEAGRRSALHEARVPAPAVRGFGGLAGGAATADAIDAARPAHATGRCR